MDSAREFYANLPPPAECLAILLGLGQVSVFGLGAIANPIEYAKGYGLPLALASSLKGQSASSKESQKADEAEKTQIALVGAIAARNIGSGALILTLACYAKDRRALGMAVAANFVATLADTMIVRWFGVENGVAGHVFGIVGSLGIGSSLLYWKRNDPWW